MKNKYNIAFSRIIILALMSVSFAGCNKWLDIKPENEQTNDEFWSSKEEVDAVMMGAYAKTRMALNSLVFWGEIRSDEVDLGPAWNANDDMRSIKDLEIRPDNSVCKWVDIYSVIGRCNSVIVYASEVMLLDKTFTQKACDAYVAEAKWLRGLCYFYLVRSFCDVPYITTPYLDDNQEFRIPKMAGDKVLERIIADLNEAKHGIPIIYDGVSWQNKGRGTLWSLYALLADIHLWRGNYDKSLEMCDNIIKSGLFSIMPNAQWYTIYYPGNSNESIFELQWNNLLGQTNNLFQLFHNGTQNNSMSISVAAKEKFAEFPDDIDIRSAGGSYVDAKVWKYAGTACGVDNIRGSDQHDANWIIYRLSDIMMMQAEAKFMLGGDANYESAYEIVKSIRTRAGCVTHPQMPDNESDALDLILNERLREFCFEGKRWFDLVRVATRNNAQYKNKLIKVLLANVAPKDRPLYEAKLQNTYGFYFPINDMDIDASTGVLTQNPYYK